MFPVVVKAVIKLFGEIQKSIYPTYFKHTPESYVVLQEVLICSVNSNLHTSLRKKEEFSIPRIYISTKSLKHSYDRRPDFTTLYLDDVHLTLKDPDCVLENVEDKDGTLIVKRGHFIFCRKLVGRKNKYLACPVEVDNRGGATALFCVSFFPSKSSYIKKFPTLWDREAGESPPS